MTTPDRELRLMETFVGLLNVRYNKAENMRRLPLHLLLAAAAGCALPALASSDAVSVDAPAAEVKVDAPAAVAAAPAAEVKMAITGHIDLAADRGRKVYIEFLASPRLTAAVRASLASSGFELVDSREQAEVVYELDGVFQALRPATQRTAEVRVGDYAENPAPLATKSGRGVSMMLSPNPLVMLIGTIVSNVGDATGVHDLVNEATAGDPDGKCLSHCETWRYRQRSVVNMTRKAGTMEQKCSVLATTEDAELVPARLIQSSLAGLREAAGLIVDLDLSANPALAN